MVTPLDNLTSIETGQDITAVDEHGNTYQGTFEWDSDEEAHFLNEYKLVAHYEEDELYLVKPIDSDTLSGFLTKITSIKV